MLAYSRMKGKVLSSTAPALGMYRILFIVYNSCQAGLLTEEGSSALKYRTCEQNVSDDTHRCRTLGRWPTPR